MLTKFIFLVFSLHATLNQSANIRHAQLVGVWQELHSVGAAGWGDTYRFFKDSTFLYHSSQMLENKHVASIRGKFRLERDSLTLIIHSAKVSVGTKAYRAIPDAEWLAKDDYKWFAQKPYLVERIGLSSCKRQDLTARCLQFDYTEYLKMSDDPTKYP